MAEPLPATTNGASDDETVEITLPPELQALSDLVSQKPESFARGSEEIRSAALDATKFIFDLSLQSESASLPPISEFLNSLNTPSVPRTRSSQAQAKLDAPKKSTKFEPFQPTELTSLFVDGMDDEQIWAQLELKAQRVCKMLETALEIQDDDEEGDEEEELPFGKGEDDEDEIDIEELRKLGLEEGMDLDDLEDDDEDEDEDSDDGEEDEDYGLDEPLGEDTAPLRDRSDSSLPTPTILDAMSKLKRPQKKFKPDPHGLNDGFFDLRSFNTEIEAAEARSSSRGALRDDDDDEGEEDVDLFAPIGMESLNFDEEDLENAGEDEEGGDASGVFYKDFFEPPPKASKNAPKKPSKPTASQAETATEPARKTTVRFAEEVKVRKIKAKGKNLPVASIYQPGPGGFGGMLDEDDEDEGDEFNFDDLEGEEGYGEIYDDDEEHDGEENEVESEDEDDIGFSSTSSKKRKFARFADEDEDEDGDEEAFSTRETIERLKDDLFADDSDSDSDAQKDLSKHEKRMAALQQQIAALETENVGPKDWVLMGEATSRTRPQNSLLEQDLEFDRVAHIAPAITTESVAALEERIKSRILEGRFDDVVRRKKGEDKPFLPSRWIELRDTKDTGGLAKSYEDEYLEARGGGGGGDDRDGRLKKEHDEIEKAWEGICSKLDALCNAHFTPKQPKAIISSVSNVATTTLESALPTTKSISTLLAPEEIFSAPSQSRARSELTPKEKQTLRSKERKQKKKLRETLAKARGTKGVIPPANKSKGIGGVKQDKKKALESVVKTGRGVTVVGKRREDVIGKGKGPGKKGKS